MNVKIDERLTKDSIYLANWSLSTLYLKNNANFPWLILVPRVDNIQEIYQLSPANRQTVIEEIAAISQIMENYFKPDKLNVAALGNIVPQLHIHIVGRFEGDKAWPHSIWQPDLTPAFYSEEILLPMIAALREQTYKYSGMVYT